MMKDYTVISAYNHTLEDPVFSEVLIRVAEWANKEGLENRKCTDFLIKRPSSDPLDRLTQITCDIEEIIEND